MLVSNRCVFDAQYRHSSTPNQYQQAIQAIGNILAPYDSDQHFPVWGFVRACAVA